MVFSRGDRIVIRWTKIHDNYWILNYKDKTYKIESIEKLFVFSLGFGLKFNEIEYALLKLNRLNHNFAEFSKWNKLILTNRKLNGQLYN